MHGTTVKITVLEFITQYIYLKFWFTKTRSGTQTRLICENFLTLKAGKQRYETQHNHKQQPHTAARTQQHILPAPTRIPQCRLRALPQGNRRNVHLRMSRAQMNVTAFRKPYTMPSRSSVN